jgi:hypothetical protein
LKLPERRHDRQTDLARKRQTLNLLKERLDALAADAEAQTGALSEDEEEEERGEVVGEEQEEEEEEEEGESLVTPSTTEGSHENGYEGGQEEDKEKDGVEEVEDERQLNLPTTTATATVASPTSTLRYRHHHQSLTPTRAATTTARSISTRSPSSTTALFPDNTTIPSPQPLLQSPSPRSLGAEPAVNTESILSAHRQEQETLTDSLLTLATQLKASSQAFQSSLEAEKAVLGRAAEGLDRNLTGIDAAGKRMGMLRRMTEGRGWFGRVLMYIWIFALWLVALAIVFLGPKLRF